MKAALLALFGVGAAAAAGAVALGENDAGGVVYRGPDLSNADLSPDDFGDVYDTENQQMTSYRDHPMLRLVQRYESAGRYNILYGNRTFDSFADHPWAHLYDASGKYRTPGGDWSQVPEIRSGVNKGKRSTAAGRYQIMAATWNPRKLKYGFPDFSPDSQDRCAFELLNECGALASYNAGALDVAIQKASRIWTSLPGSTTGEAQLSLASAIDVLKGYA